MSRRLKLTLIVNAAVIVALLLSAAVWIKLNSRDVLAPDVSDLAVETLNVPDENNAYVYFEKTASFLDWPEDDPRVSAILVEGKWDDAVATDLLSRNAQTLTLLKRGLACPTYEPHEGPRLETPKLSYRWFHDIAGLMRLEAATEKHVGQTDRLWQSCLDQCRLGSFVTARPRGILDFMSGMMVLRQAADQAEQLLRESSPREPELVTLLDQLNAIGSLDAGAVRTIKEEFQLVAEVINRPDSLRTRHPLLASYVFQPNRTRRMCAEYFRAVVRTVSRPYAEVHLPEFNPLPPPGVRTRLLPLKRNAAGRIVAAWTTSPDAIGRVITSKCSTQSRLDGLRLVVACRLYEIRQGRLPQALEALVPQYIREVPRDPFDGRPFRYLPDRAVVYSVGLDLKDSTGSVPGEPDVQPSTRGHRKPDDLVYAIHGKTE